MLTQSPNLADPTKKMRDQRLDFFRGLAMFIILLAHTPGNPWTLWIPARFGFSDATEIFVFCSGMASAMAFGAVFVNRSWYLGTARIAFRVWQVYWAHIGVVLVTAVMMVGLDSLALGTPGKVYSEWFPIAGLFSRTHETLFGLFTLSYVPGLFDILPMYLVILAMVPIVMGLYRIGGRNAAFAFIVVVWLCANLSGYARTFLREQDFSPEAVASLGFLKDFLWMNFPGIPWQENATWFFNPFGWQLVFFTGFSFAMGWIPAPPIRRWMVWAAIAVIVITLPVAWHKMFQYLTGYVPQHWGGELFWNINQAIEPVRWKSWVGGWRYLHFLAVAYLAYVVVGPNGVRLNTGWGVVARARATRLMIGVLCGAVVLATVPYTYIHEIKLIAPGLDRWLFETVPLIPGRYIGLPQLVHLAALIMGIWHSIGDNARRWLVQDAFLATVPVIRKVGTQSLAVFLVSIVLSRFNGWAMDSMSAYIEQSGWSYLTGRDVWMLALVNLSGFAVLIAVAYGVSWFKKQPWRERTSTRPNRAKSPATIHPVAAE